MGENNIREYIDLFMRRKILIIVILLIGIISGGVLTYKNTQSYIPQYISKITVGIDSTKTQKQEEDKDNEDQNSAGNSSNYLNYNNAAVNENIATKYKNISTSSAVYKAIELKTGIKRSQITSIIANQQEEIPHFIDITVTGDDAKSVQIAANAIPEIYNTELIRIIGVDCVESIYQADEGQLIPKPLDLTMLKTVAVSVAVAIFLVLLLECLNTKIITPDDAEKCWDLPVIGVIPMNVEQETAKHRIKR